MVTSDVSGSSRGCTQPDLVVTVDLEGGDGFISSDDDTNDSCVRLVPSIVCRVL